MNKEVTIIVSAKDLATQTFNTMGNTIKRNRADIAALGTALMAIGAAVTGGIGAVIYGTAQAAEEIDLLAKRTGMAREELQGLAYAAKQEGTDISTLGTQLARLTRTMFEAAGGGKEAAKVFGGIGVAISDAGGLRSAGDVLLDVADYMANAQNETEAMAVALKIFGRGAAEIVPFLRMGKEEIKRLIEEARRLGYVLKEEDVVAFEAFGDRVETAKAALAGVGKQIAVDCLPYLRSLVSVVIDLGKWLNTLPEGLRRTITLSGTFAGTISLVAGTLLLIVSRIPALLAGLAALKISLSAFGIGSAILVGLGLLAGAFLKIRDNARLANLEIAKTSDLADLAGEKRRLQGEIARTKASIEGLKDLQKREKEGKNLPADIIPGGYGISPYAPAFTTGDFSKDIAALDGQLGLLEKRYAKLLEQEKKVLLGPAGGGEGTRTAKDVIDELNLSLAKAAAMEELLGDQFDLNAARAAAYYKALEELASIDPKNKKLGEYVKGYLTEIGLRQADEAIQAKADLVARTNQLTMSELEYQLWALDEEKKAFEERYKGQRDMLEQFQQYYEAKVVSINQTYADNEIQVQADMVARTNQLTMTEMDYQIWALNEERKQFEKTYAGKKEILDDFAAYYNARMAAITGAPEETIKAILAAVTPEQLAITVRAQGYLAGAMGGDWDPGAFQREALRGAINETVAAMLRQGKSWAEIQAAIDPLVDRFRGLREEVDAWAELQDLAARTFEERLGTFGKFLASLQAGGDPLTAAFTWIISESEAVAEVFNLLLEGAAALLAPIDALIGLIEGLIGKPGLGAVAGAGVGYLIAGPIGAVVGAIAGLLGGAKRDWAEFLKEANATQLYGKMADLREVLERLTGRHAEAVERDIAEIEAALDELFGTTREDLGGLVADAFSAKTADEFTTDIGRGLLSKARDALIRVWMESAAMTPLFDAFADSIREAIADGVMTSVELEAIQAIIGQIQDYAGDFYDILDQLGLGMDDLTDSVNAASEAIRNAPEGFRLGLYEYEAIGPGTTEYSQTSSSQSSGRSTTFVFQPGSVLALNPEDFYAAMKRIESQENVRSSGTFVRIAPANVA